MIRALRVDCGVDQVRLFVCSWNGFGWELDFGHLVLAARHQVVRNGSCWMNVMWLGKECNGGNGGLRIYRGYNAKVYTHNVALRWL